jgi:hypothetical protein
MLDKLNSLNGDDFRKQYFSDQVSAHKDAVSLFKRYGNGGDNLKLKNWATTTLPALQHHLDMAQGLSKNTYGIREIAHLGYLPCQDGRCYSSPGMPNGPLELAPPWPGRGRTGGCNAEATAHD